MKLIHYGSRRELPVVYDESVVIGKLQEVRRKVLSGSSDNNIAFADLCHLLEGLGFTKRTRGGHFMYSMEGVVDMINLQPKCSKAKGYQVRQVRAVLQQYHLGEQ